MRLLRFITILLLLCLQAIAASAQSCWENVNTTTTDWRRFPLESQNSWNWTDTGMHEFYMKQYNYPVSGGPRTYVNSVPVLLRLPYYCLLPLGSGGCGNKNTNPLHNILPDSMDIFPEDGWELVVKNFGYCPGGVNCSPSNAVENPFFALYNKYTGRLKVFIMVASKYDKQGLEILIHFEQFSKRRALFAHATPFAKAVQEFDSSLYFRNPNHYAMDDLYWVWADVQLSYDVCNCTDNSITEIEIQPRLIQNANIELVGDGTITDANIMNSTSTSGVGFVSQNATVKRSFFKTAFDGFNAGMEGYNTWKGAADSYNKTFNTMGSEYKDFMFNQWWKNVIEKIPTYQSFTPHQQDSIFDAYSKSSDRMKTFYGVRNLTGTNELLGNLKNLATFVPYVGVAVGVLDFFSQGGNKKEETVSTAAPMSFNVNLKFKGSITTSTDLPPIYFYTPGSPAQPNTSKKPFYNNTLGVFSLIRTPKLEYAEYWNPLRTYTGGSNSYETIRRFRQYRLRSGQDLKYVLNPAADLEVYSIDAAYILEYTKNTIQPAVTDLKFCKQFIVVNGTSHPRYRYGQIPLMLGNPKNYKDSTLISKIHNNTDLKVEYVADNFDANTDGTAKIRFRTDYVPISCLKDVSFFLEHNGAAEFAPRVLLKLYVKLKRKDSIANPDAELVTQVLTYDMGFATESSTRVDSDDDSLHFTYVNQYYENLREDCGVGTDFFNDFYRYPDYIEGNPYFPNNYYSRRVYHFHTGDHITRDIYARDSIIIDGGVIIDANVRYLVAGKEVIISPDNILAPDITVRITQGTGMECTGNPSGNMANADEISNICQSTQYTSRIASKWENNFIDPLKEEEKEFSFRLFPNPSSNIAYASYILSMENTEPVSLTVTDLLGREILHPLQNTYLIGEQATKLNFENIEAGVYFVNIQIGEKRYTERLVLTK